MVFNRFYLTEIDQHHGTFCLFKTVTGYPCPSCGVGHGINSIMSFNLKSAFFYNPFSLVVALAGLIIPLWIFIDLVRKNYTLYSFNDKINGFLKRRPLVIFIMILLVLSNWVWNLIKY